MSKDDVFSFAISSLVPDIYRLESDDAMSSYRMETNHTIINIFGKNGLKSVTQAIPQLNLPSFLSLKLKLLVILMFISHAKNKRKQINVHHYYVDHVLKTKHSLHAHYGSGSSS